MNRLISTLIVIGVATCGCRSEEGSDTSLQQFPSDEEVMQMAYDFNHTVPDGFFVDERSDTPGSYTIYHVKDDSISYELCTDDVTEALAWEAADNASRSVNGAYVELYENARYFEIVRDLENSGGVGNTTDPTTPGFSRVFKCSYVDRNGVDRNIRNGYAGTLHARPLSEGAIRMFAEYLWQFTFFWPQQKTVLQSFSREQDDAFEHTLRLAFITIQGTGQCDLVEVVDWVFRADKNDGQVTKEFRPLYEFNAEFVNGGPRKCAG